MALAKRLPTAVKLLLVLHLLLSIGAFVGGGGLVIDPSGNLLMLPLAALDQSPFSNYFIPGLILLVLFGFLPLVIIWGAIRRPRWKAADFLSPFKRYHWAWSFSLYTGFALVIWIIIQTYIFQEVHLIHLVYAGFGLLIQAVTVLPQVQAWAKENGVRAYT